VADLDVVATVFLPLGFFGQNFGWLTRHIDSPAAFSGYGLGSLAPSAAVLHLW